MIMMHMEQIQQNCYGGKTQTLLQIILQTLVHANVKNAEIKGAGFAQRKYD